MRFGILTKFLVAFLVLSLLPLVILSFYASSQLISVGQSAVESSRQALLENSKSLLQARAQSVARQVELFLQTAEDDLRSLSLLPFDSSLYRDFSRSHRRQIWIRTGTRETPREEKILIPLYREITYADSEGIEQIRIEEDRIIPSGRDISKPFQSAFGEEDYFRAVANEFLLSSDVAHSTHNTTHNTQIYVSHLLGAHVRKDEQLQDAPDVESAVGGAVYEGIIRFAMPVFRQGEFRGIVSLALDHRHLMEYTQHVLPIGTQSVVFPSYASGNYAFLFDDEGWIITHPKFWDIRGYDRETGHLVNPLSDAYNEETMKAGLVPFNLFHVPFIHINYRHIAETVLAGTSGVTTTSSVGGVSRILAYAPIRFSSGEYRKTGYFGGVTLGAQSGAFHRSVDETPSAIQMTLYHTIRHFAIIILTAACSVASIAIILAKSFTRPILLLVEKAKEISKGKFDVSVGIRSGDELEILGSNFEEMGRQLEKHRRRLMHSLEALETSRKAAVTERDFIESIFSNMMSGLVVVDRSGLVCSLNHRAEQILNLPPRVIGQPAEEVLKAYPAMLSQLRVEVKENEAVNSDFELLMPDGQKKHLEMTISILPSTPSSVVRRELSVASGPSPVATSSIQHPASGDQHPASGIRQPPTANHQPPILIIFRDVTKRKRMESHLRRSDRLVSLGTLAAGIAHEIRNPLTGISLLLDDLHDRMGSQSEDRILMQRALEEIEKLEKIVTELLEFASKPSSHPVIKDLNEVIDYALFLVNKQCKKQKVSVIRNTDAPVPLLRLDPEKMKQALLNILLNALNVMPDGGEIRITVQAHERLDIFEGKSGVELSVSDTGPGISPDDIEYIFDPFFTRNPNGFGLGLSITHTIIEEHKGKIIAESEPGNGACFKIFLPLS
jgi:nitrogen fixation/metabolism regulation signal transduction histidine kinase